MAPSKENIHKNLPVPAHSSSVATSAPSSVPHGEATVDTGFASRDRFDHEHPRLPRILATLHKTADPGPGYAVDVMRLVQAEIKDHPCREQLPWNPTPPSGKHRELRRLCFAICQNIPPHYFPHMPSRIHREEKWKVHQDHFLHGILNFLRSERVQAVLSPPTPHVDPSPELHEGRSLPSRPRIKKEIVDVSWLNHDETSSDSASRLINTPSRTGHPKDHQKQISLARHHAEELGSEAEPSMPTPMGKKGKQRAVSPHVHERMEQLDLGATERRPVISNTNAPLPTRTSSGTTKTKGMKETTKLKSVQKKKRLAAAMTEPEPESRPAKRQAVRPSNLAEQDDSSSEIEEVKIVLPRPGRRDPKDIIITDLQEQNTFLKNMFLYGAGVSEVDILTYRARVKDLNQDHRTAWKTLYASIVARANADRAND
ncbi:hypothetical protein LTR84_010157 [Exophiala bonariae]|uniref:Uncharacterized protein n=1 Tax=Exophiala bonariae TaxID=1690606 RepID=A0AAV9MTQ6_9EURO|nr:hypothetical protein LTR84_010157 [Exophiala bonariae]